MIRGMKRVTLIGSCVAMTLTGCAFQGINSLPLFVGFAGVGLLLLAFSAMWYREGR